MIQCMCELSKNQTDSQTISDLFVNMFDQLDQCCSMLSSALIGCFTVLLISVAQRKETQGKYRFKFISFGNYTVNKMRTLIFLGTETAFKWTIAFYFHFRDSLSHILCLYYGPAILTTDFTRSDAYQWCSGSVNHAPSSSVIWKWTWVRICKCWGRNY